MSDERGKPSGRGDRGKPAGRGDRPQRGGRDGAKPRSGGDAGRPGGRGSSERPSRGQGGRDQRSGPDRRSRPDRAEARTETQERYDGPPIPEEITGRELDRSVSAQLKGLPEKLALRVARHLAAADLLIDDDPETAYQHTLAARARAARLAVVREAVGEAAYAAGHYAEALAELRAAKRMNGATAYLPIMADCHPRAGAAAGGAQARQEPVGGELRAGGEGGDDAGRGRRPS